jgi:hypothetical protein
LQERLIPAKVGGRPTSGAKEPGHQSSILEGVSFYLSVQSSTILWVQLPLRSTPSGLPPRLAGINSPCKTSLQVAGFHSRELTRFRGAKPYLKQFCKEDLSQLRLVAGQLVGPKSLAISQAYWKEFHSIWVFSLPQFCESNFPSG